MSGGRVSGEGAVEGGAVDGGVLDDEVLASLLELAAEGFLDADDVLTTYRSQSAALLDGLRAAVASGDGPGLRAAVHQLKGSSATVGATALAAVCLELEDHRAWDDCDELLQRVHRLLAPTNDALRRLLRALMVEASTA